MIDITLIFKDFDTHRMPQYFMYDDRGFPIPQDKEKEIWLRIPVKLSNKHYSLEFFIQSKIPIEKIKAFGHPEDVTYFMTTQAFPDRISKVSSWNVLRMQDYHPLYDLQIDDLKEQIPGNPPNEYHVNIKTAFHEYLLDTYARIFKANEALDICKRNLEQMVSSSTASGFSYLEGDIYQYLNFIRNCASSMSNHSYKTHYFRENLRKIEWGFDELIKRKQVNNRNYQYYLEETRRAVSRLSRPDAWDGRIPLPPTLPTY